MSAVAPKPAVGALERLSEELLESYLGDERARRISRRYLPSREAIAEILQGVLDLMYPGLFRAPRLESRESRRLRRAIARRACARGSSAKWSTACATGASATASSEFGECAPRAHELTRGVSAAACPRSAASWCAMCRPHSTAIRPPPIFDEVILAYPGVLAVSVYRIAHALYDLGVPMMARIMTEWAHSKTGCDIHPGAKIGAGFFIDHATGVVIGETTEIGEGRQALPGRDLGRAVVAEGCRGHIIRGRKRHPTVEDGSTLYANATVLGGQTVVGAESVIGGSVFLTRSIPPRSRVSLKEPDLRVASRDGAAEPDAIYFDI